MSPCILALDIGTTSLRALLYDAAGRLVPGVAASQPTPLTTTADGGAEVDPERLLQAAVTCLEQALAKAGSAAAQIAGVATCTFWHSLLGVDAAGRPLTPIYTWAETRNMRAIPRLRRALDERATHARTGCHLHASYWPAKLAWLQRRDPRLFGAVQRWLSPGEYIHLRLLGEPLCSYSMASGTGIFDQNRLDWDEATIRSLGVRREQLSPLVDAGRPARGLRPEWRARLPQLATVPWFPALGDGACNNVGSGCLGREHVALMIGTSAAMRVLFAADAAEAPWGLWCYHADRRRYLVGGALSNGGNLLAWLHDTLQIGADGAWEQELAQLPPDGHGLTVLPFLAGERNPGYARGATATFSGLRWHTRPVEILQAGLEAAAYRLASIYDLLAPQVAPEAQIVASGGALLHLPAWSQIIADVLGRPLVACLESETSSRGAALLAAEALGLGRPEDAPLELGRTFTPDPARHAVYREGLARHRALYRRLLGKRSLNP